MLLLNSYFMVQLIVDRMLYLYVYLYVVNTINIGVFDDGAVEYSGN